MPLHRSQSQDQLAEVMEIIILIKSGCYRWWAP